MGSDLVVSTWSHRHDYIATLRAGGMKNVEIATEMDMDPAYVSRVLSDPRAVSKIEEIKKKVIAAIGDPAERLQKLCHIAIDALEHYTELRDPKVASSTVSSANSILDRGGVVKVERSIVAHMNITPEQLKLIHGLTKDADRATEEYDYSPPGNGREIKGSPGS